MIDEYDYPTDAQLRRVRRWKIEQNSDFDALMTFVRSLWWSPEWGWSVDARRVREYKSGPLQRRYRVSTGGWSGNESLIDALRRNFIFWAVCWRSSRRGGHYVFEVPS